jgi:transposase InsO family protein
MPWREVSIMSARCEFIVLAQSEGANVRALCRRFGIAAKTGYKWLARYAGEGVAGLADRSRRPHHSPGRVTAEMEAAVLAIRDVHPAWGGRKIAARLTVTPVPSASTITAILRRHGRIDPEESQKHRPTQRFEAPAPNVLWQMDFKGHFPLRQGHCHPLTVLDDHSRFAIGLQACGNEQMGTVQSRLASIFGRYGLPERILTDNGPPWGGSGVSDYMPLGLWLMRLGIRLIHGRPRHPQTQGKDERFHRTLKAELLRGHQLHDLAHCQREFDRWRDVYNLERPHQALKMATPASRYQPSRRSLPSVLPPIEYRPEDVVRKVSSHGEISFQGRSFRISKAFRAQPLALRPTSQDGVLDVFFCHQHLGIISLRAPEKVQLTSPDESHGSNRNSQEFTERKSSKKKEGIRTTTAVLVS